MNTNMKTTDTINKNTTTTTPTTTASLPASANPKTASLAPARSQAPSCKVSASDLPRPPHKPRLRFAPYAWAKLLYFCHKGDTEIGGFGISRPEDPLLVEDFVTVRQLTTAATVKFDDESVADFFDAQVDGGKRPEQFARIWIHTHPGESPEPSCTDEQTFLRVFGSCAWAIMFILARGGDTYARLRFNVGPGGALLVPAEVDFTAAFPASDHQAWQVEYEQNVQIEPDWPSMQTLTAADETFAHPGDPTLVKECLEHFRKMQPLERKMLLDELAEYPDLWECESEMAWQDASAEGRWLYE